jgi:amino acid permease
MASREENDSPLMANEMSENETISISSGNGSGQNSSNNSDEELTNVDESQQRKGTLPSASFNILSTMVGGGSLSLPLAFHQAGKGFLAPGLLLLIGYLVKHSIHLLIHGANFSTNGRTNNTRKGTVSFESVTCAAFGPYAKYFSMGLVYTICFFTIVGYGVLLRDMLLPLSDAIFPTHDAEITNNGPTLAHNATLLFVILIVTPLCTMRDLTPLQSVGAASMISIFTVSCCVSYRSLQCNLSPAYDEIRKMPWYDYVTLVPPSSSEEDFDAWDNISNALPILFSVFMCHFNVLPVHNELSNPSPQRINSLFRTTMGGASLFYVFTGFLGSMYGNCTKSGVVEGNVLLSFDEDDILILIGRVCLSLTITFAFPILVVPARDTFLRGMQEFLDWKEEKGKEKERKNRGVVDTEYRLGDDSADNNLGEPLLLSHEKEKRDGDDDDGHNIIDFDLEDDGHLEGEQQQEQQQQNQPTAKKTEANSWRIASSICIFWLGAAIACRVQSIDIVWDFLGGSVSLMLGFIIPSGSFLVLTRLFNKGQQSSNGGDGNAGSNISSSSSMFDTVIAWALLVMNIPLMFILTGNTIYNLDL